MLHLKVQKRQKNWTNDDGNRIFRYIYFLLVLIYTIKIDGFTIKRTLLCSTWSLHNGLILILNSSVPVHLIYEIEDGVPENNVPLRCRQTAIAGK